MGEEKDARILDLMPLLQVSHIVEQMRDVFGVPTEHDVPALDNEARAVAQSATTEYLQLFGMGKDSVDYLHTPENIQRRQIRLMPRRDNIEADFIHMSDDPEQADDIGIDIRPHYFGRFQAMIVKKDSPEETIETRRAISVETGYVFLLSLSTMQQCVNQLQKPAEATELDELLEQTLETGLSSYITNFTVIDEALVSDYRQTGLLPRLAARLAYEHATKQLRTTGCIEPGAEETTMAEMLDNRYMAANAALIDNNISPSQADIGMAKPLSNKETHRVLNGLSVFARMLL